MCCRLNGDFENCEVLLCVSVIHACGCLHYCFLFGRHYGFTTGCSIGEFDTSTETFTAYHERLEQYFVANRISLYSSEASEAVKATANKNIFQIL